MTDLEDLVRQADAAAAVYGALFKPLEGDPRPGVHRTDSPLSAQQARRLVLDLLKLELAAEFEAVPGFYVVLVPK